MKFSDTPSTRKGNFRISMPCTTVCHSPSIPTSISDNPITGTVATANPGIHPHNSQHANTPTLPANPGFHFLVHSLTPSIL
ncbi:MAG: hypothetical protein BWY82_02451 [Verrucomicrobia bacterium ADurb.Bin474]|nr:MAG: hypothetical protein BWY82_02451 [Verrucomicrobia bacterium ADurb.Bin474]